MTRFTDFVVDSKHRSVPRPIMRVMGRVGFEPTTPAMSRRYPNQARPPAQYIMKKFVAQIYVVDRLYVGTN